MAVISNRQVFTDLADKYKRSLCKKTKHLNSNTSYSLVFSELTKQLGVINNIRFMYILSMYIFIQSDVWTPLYIY